MRAGHPIFLKQGGKVPPQNWGRKLLTAKLRSVKKFNRFEQFNHFEHSAQKWV